MNEKITKMNEADLGPLLHSTLFSLQRAIQETSHEQAIVISSHAAKFLGTIEKAKGTNLFSGINTDEAIKNFVKFTDDSIYFDNVEFKKLNEEEYEIKIIGCALAKGGIHKILNPEKDICPMAMIAAAVLKHNNQDADVIIDPSEFTENDSITKINFFKYN